VVEAQGLLTLLMILETRYFDAPLGDCMHLLYYFEKPAMYLVCFNHIYFCIKLV
jgi:hypothetical protein